MFSLYFVAAFMRKLHAAVASFQCFVTQVLNTQCSCILIDHFRVKCQPSEIAENLNLGNSSMDGFIITTLLSLSFKMKVSLRTMFLISQFSCLSIKNGI